MKKAILALVIFLILGPLAYLIFRPNLILSKEEAKKQFSLPISRFLNWKGAEIHYLDEGQGPPVLMLHGFAGSYRNFQKLSDSLHSEYRCIRVDLPGFGLSDFPGKNDGSNNYVQEYKDFITFLMDTLHIDSAYVIGNSMGGGLGWLTAIDHSDKVKKLVLLNSAGYDLDQVRSGLFIIRNAGWARHILDKGIPIFISRNRAGRAFADKNKIVEKELEQSCNLANRDGNLQHLFAMAQADGTIDTTLIQKVNCPTLIVWGKQDLIIPVAHAERFHRDIKNSQLVVIDTCGHIPMIERPDETARAIRKFLKELSSVPQH